MSEQEPACVIDVIQCVTKIERSYLKNDPPCTAFPGGIVKLPTSPQSQTLTQTQLQIINLTVTNFRIKIYSIFKCIII